MDKKKEWKKPELIVIIRCKSEENVLAACKQAGSCTEANGTAHGWASS